MLLFGSVACADANEHGDIDLVAIHDELGDYSDILGADLHSLWPAAVLTAECITGSSHS